MQAHPSLSGIAVLADGRGAFAARAALADAAQRTLDLQYYIWHNDSTGLALFDAVRRAADRGVRVRFLMDDNNSAEIEDVLRTLDAHPNIEVRLFNPVRHRRWRVLDFLTDFDRVNRRMHNKSMTADNQVSIVGGRNVGDEYFGAESGMVYVDLDVLAVGAVVPQVSRDFDRYWASASSYPLASVLEAAPPPAGAGADAAAAAARARSACSPPRRRRWCVTCLHGTLVLEWAPVAMVSDDPAKGLGRAAVKDMLWAQLQTVVPAAAQEFQLVSALLRPARPRRRAADLAGTPRASA